MLQNLLAPYRPLGIRFMPTGGVTPANVESYLAIPEIVAVGGTWLAKAKEISAAAESGDWSAIAAVAAEAAAVAAKYAAE
ncbi:MAG: hypothetical protein J6S21_01180 [Victivallales bacterium]|nr:hypothetical protein [Victivallales bacterium]